MRLLSPGGVETILALWELPLGTPHMDHKHTWRVWETREVVVAVRSPAVIDSHQVGDQHEGVRQHAGKELQGRAGLLSGKHHERANTYLRVVLTPVTACE